ncbi:hypothetical protein [Streptomyces sp. NBC_00564]|uniref:hypothetical protein n=1 Tax=Streptomyces sp. NBC_00564 TaxID=2903663 RepID=UPI00352FE2A6|nr:hypothetical protein OG256_04845 [Streptomyces sp. NBC_00564]
MSRVIASQRVSISSSRPCRNAATLTHVSKTSVAYWMQSAQLEDIQACNPERQGRWSFSSQQATLHRLDKAFAAFFCWVKVGEIPGYSRIRRLNRFGTVESSNERDGYRWGSTPAQPDHPCPPPGRQARSGQSAPPGSWEGQDRFGVVGYRPGHRQLPGQLRQWIRPQPALRAQGGDLPTGVAAKVGLTRSIADAGWGCS